MSKPVINYVLLNVAFITFFTCFIIIAFAQQKNPNTIQEQNSNTTKIIKELTPEQIKKVEDSLLQVFNKEQEAVIKKLSREYPVHKKINVELRKEEKQTYENYVEAVNLFLSKQGRKDKVISSSDIKKQLKEGELELVKDSICVESRKKFLSKKTVCKKYEYHFYLKDSKGKLEKLW